MNNKKRLIATGLISLACLCFSCPSVHSSQVNVIELDNQIISPVTQQYILEALERSEKEKAECLIIKLDTPGGLLESTRTIVKAMMNAKIPVVVYVAPSGSRAGSAGVFITLAAHIAAMAPSTNIGAAHPVLVGEGGGPMKKLIRRIKREDEVDEGNAKEELVEEEQKDPMSEKIINDTVAWITTIARARYRNEEWAKKAVTESFSISEEEAVKEKVIDFVAKDLGELLLKIDGWPVEFGLDKHVISTKNATVVHIAMNRRQQFLAVITNPTIAYLLMLLGTLGLVFEFTHPGIGFPGIAGFICIILAMYAFQTLPINYAALALIGVGLALLVAEIKVAGFGLLAVGGVISLTLGSLMLFESPGGIALPLTVIAPVVLGISAIVLFLVNLAVKAQKQPETTGAQGLIGLTGSAETDISPSGQVFVKGEIWTARIKEGEPIKKRELIRVIGIEGLTLLVSKL
jgi:membrane-bound serine protease (ClpP class)